jgi:hypothetical protein
MRGLRKLPVLVYLGLAVAAFVRGYNRWGRIKINVDAAFYQHGGWYMTQGARLYLDIFDIKPPLNFELTYLLAVLSGGNALVLHILAVGLTVTAAAFAIYSLTELTHELTGNDVGSALAGLTLLTLPGYHYLSAFGYRPKYVTLALGFGGLLLLYRSRPVLGVALATAAAATWQFGLIFPLLALGLVFQCYHRTDAYRATAGAGVVTVTVLMPIILSGASVAMVREVLLIPVLTSTDSGSLVNTLRKGVASGQLSGLLTPFSIAGLYKLARQRFKQSWWVLTGTLWATLQIFYFDFDAYPDLFLGLAFVSIGVGVFYSSSGQNTKRILSMLVAVMLLVSAVLLGGVGPTSPQRMSETNFPDQLDELPYGRDDIEGMYWKQLTPETCTYRWGVTEQTWAADRGLDTLRQNCGTVPVF